jgi:hypothetical protein
MYITVSSHAAVIKRVRIPALVALALILAAPLPAQTILLAVREMAGGVPLPTPLPVRESLEGSLFDQGFIVFDFRVPSPSPSREELARIGRSAGAGCVLEVLVTYVDTAISTHLVRIVGTADFALIDVDTGEVTAQGGEKATNRDREREVDRPALGREIGTLVSARVAKALRNAPAAP